MTRGSIIGGSDDITRAPHFAPDAKHIRRNSFSLPSALPLGATRLHGVRARKDHASFPASGASFERSQIAKALLDVGSLLFGSLYVLLWIVVILGLIPFSIFVLLFIQL